MNKVDAALLVAARHVPRGTLREAFDALGDPLAKLEYALAFMPHGENYAGPSLLRPEDAKDFETVNAARIDLST